MKRFILAVALCALAACGSTPDPDYSRTHVYSESIVIGGVEFEGWVPTDGHSPLILYPKDR